MGFITKLIWSLFSGPRVERTRRQQSWRQSSLFFQKSKKVALEEIDALLSMGEYPTARVIYVIDGDTVLVTCEGHEITIRLDSIDCPEGDQPWGPMARAGLIKLIGGKTVRLEIHGCDDYGRTLATLYVRKANGLEWINVNERLLILGHAWVLHMYLDHLPRSRQAKLWRLQNWSRSRGVGLWANREAVPPWAWRSAKQDMS